MKSYDDIIHLPRFVSKNRKHMSNHDRAAQFAPFAALTGYDESIRETARLTDEEIQLQDDAMEELNERFMYIQHHVQEHPIITIVYFVQDPYKYGGKYEEYTIQVRQIDLQERMIQTMDRKKYALDYIIRVESELFEKEGEDEAI